MARGGARLFRSGAGALTSSSKRWSNGAITGSVTTDHLGSRWVTLAAALTIGDSRRPSMATPALAAE